MESDTKRIAPPPALRTTDPKDRSIKPEARLVLNPILILLSDAALRLVPSPRYAVLDALIVNPPVALLP